MDKKKTAKSKPNLKNSTLLDEFEKNVKIVTKILDNSINKIDLWIKDFSKLSVRFIPQRTSNDVITILESFYPFADTLPEIRHFIISYAPEHKDKIEEEYSNINNKIEEIVGKCSQHPLKPSPKPVIPYAEMCQLKKYLEEMTKVLRFCVKKAREESAARANEQNNPIWTKPLGLKKWAAVFNVSESTVRRWFKDKKYENKKISDRKWSILYKDLPAEVVARVKNQTS